MACCCFKGWRNVVTSSFATHTQVGCHRYLRKTYYERRNALLRLIWSTYLIRLVTRTTVNGRADDTAGGYMTEQKPLMFYKCVRPLFVVFLHLLRPTRTEERNIVWDRCTTHRCMEVCFGMNQNWFDVVTPGSLTFRRDACCVFIFSTRMVLHHELTLKTRASAILTVLPRCVVHLISV